MSIGDNFLADTAADLRRAFDASFAAPLESATGNLTDVLAIEVGGDPYALLLQQIASLLVDCKITGVPSPVAELLGIIGVRGVLIPIYDLSALLGYPPGRRSRWIAVAQTSQPVGLAFDHYEAHFRVAEAALSARNEHSGLVRPHVRRSVQVDGASRPIIDVTSLLETIRRIHS